MNRPALKLVDQASGDPRTGKSRAEMSALQAAGRPVVGERRGGDANLLLAILIAAGLGGWTFLSLSGKREVRVASAPQVAVLESVEEGAAKPAAMAVELAPESAAGGVGSLSEPQRLTNVLSDADRIAERASSPALIFDRGGMPSRTGSLRIADAPGESEGSPNSAGPPAGMTENEIFSWRLDRNQPDRSYATESENLSHTVLQGTIIAAVLETAINSDLPGYVRAFVTTDVRGFDDENVLIPAGSKLIGEYKSGVSAGQRRAYVVWTRLIRPDGVSVTLAAPATTANGETGIPGEVDTHFSDRFGAAILMTLVGAAASDSGNTVVISSSTSAAAAAVQNGQNISPTITVPQGEPIRVFTSRDLDFSGVKSWVPQ